MHFFSSANTALHYPNHQQVFIGRLQRGSSFTVSPVDFEANAFMRKDDILIRSGHMQPYFAITRIESVEFLHLFNNPEGDVPAIFGGLFYNLGLWAQIVQQYGSTKILKTFVEYFRRDRRYQWMSL
ncbi:hypothetical protein AcW1_008319 [Taiwanofungus camphoratus]|nr:hypothetical protein AcW1_008319 [Antrodia cinnamomea]